MFEFSPSLSPTAGWDGEWYAYVVVQMAVISNFTCRKEEEIQNQYCNPSSDFTPYYRDINNVWNYDSGFSSRSETEIVS